ncbi:IS630 family transposase [Streptomyces sp. NPDC056227]|uniref:IS630 family transposase n=1 Tax=Streptomyces sp. NPDC056227 TaxID=3345753 RepID=UPI0035E07E57
MRAVAALVAERDREDVAAVFGVSLKAVDIWWAKWQAAVRQAVLDHRPCDMGLSGQLWTRRLVGELIAKLYRVRLTEVGVGKCLKRWGLSFQRPDKRAVEQDLEVVARWHEETWPKIRVKARKDGGEILFADQVGIRSDQVTGRTWGEKGRTPVVRRSGNRFSVNAMSAISTRGRMHFMVFTAEVMCRFLDRLAGHFDHKVHLVVDGHSAHRSRKVRDWLAAHPDDVKLHFLPPYSPELNPDELVNADLKHSLPKQHRARDQAELAAETRRFFYRRQRQPHIVRGYFGGPHVRYILDENPMSF